MKNRRLRQDHAEALLRGTGHRFSHGLRTHPLGGAVPAELFRTDFCSFGDCRDLFGSLLKGKLPVTKPVFLPR
ncbi:MAG: hypothetical protein IJT50_09765 [Lentisphaeria bacterium]|nr:hypothetical protein [Lentisphaeria bacterium]